MIIEINNWKLVQDGTTFNLIQVVESEETLITEVEGKKTRIKTGKLIKREVESGYNMSLDYCIKKITMTNLSEKELVVNLEQWVKMYREERESITNLINNLI